MYLSFKFHTSPCKKTGGIPLLFMQQGEERSSRNVLSDNGKLTRVIQTRPNKLDDTWMVQSTENGNFTAKHVHVRLGAVGVGSIA